MHRFESRKSSNDYEEEKKRREKGKEKKECVGILLGATPVSVEIIYRKNIFRAIPLP